MIQHSRMDDVKLPIDDHPIGAVTILDADGKVLRVVPAAEFRRGAKAASPPVGRSWRRFRKSA
jgi:hypothetical protein